MTRAAVVKFFCDPSPWFFCLLMVTACIGAAVYFEARDHPAREWCKVAVHTLLTTRDPIELQRAGMIIYQLNCWVGQYLDEEPRP